MLKFLEDFLKNLGTVKEETFLTLVEESGIKNGV